MGHCAACMYFTGIDKYHLVVNGFITISIAIKAIDTIEYQFDHIVIMKVTGEMVVRKAIGSEVNIVQVFASPESKLGMWCFFHLRKLRKADVTGLPLTEKSSYYL